MAAGMADASNLGTKNLPPVDPFHDTDALLFEVKKRHSSKRLPLIKRREENWLFP